jgi:hypothetical protein
MAASHGVLYYALLTLTSHLARYNLCETSKAQKEKQYQIIFYSVQSSCLHKNYC